MSEIQKPKPIPESELLGSPEIEVGQWYWYKSSQGELALVCVVRIGSNYAKLEGPGRWSTRVHFDQFDQCCERVENPDEVIERKIGFYRSEVKRLLAEVHALTDQLGVGQRAELPSGEEQQALVRHTEKSHKPYQKALEKAKKETLPKLFDKIKHANEEMAEWMSAPVIPMKAQAGGLRGIIETIEDRIFNVELYAGLNEEIVMVRDGEPAPMNTKIHILQRRCYMDEECLARYQVGGMEFKNIKAFDKWLSRPDNMNRLLPFPRCAVAFRVRRHAKVRNAINLLSYLSILDQEPTDKITFLYFRNGDQMFRLQTEIEFGAQLFPDMQKSVLTSKLWARSFAGRITDDPLISDEEHQAMIEEERKEQAEIEARLAAAPEKDHWFIEHHGPWPSEDYVPFDKSEVMYDDIAKRIANEIKAHNRIALVLQGILDRSPVFHPHPPWQIWTPDGFEQALELVYDDTRVLVAGAKPNFEAYRTKLNASLKVGSVTVGQERAWMRHEAEKENRRRDNALRSRGDFRYLYYRPYGNPGPGKLARVTAYSLKKQTCSYEWDRDRMREEGKIKATIAVSVGTLLNVDAYQPGDFRQFFDDPRTRMEYLRWAPYLLEAEEYLAGNRKVGEPGAEDGMSLTRAEEGED